VWSGITQAIQGGCVLSSSQAGQKTLVKESPGCSTGRLTNRCIRKRRPSCRAARSQGQKRCVARQPCGVAGCYPNKSSAKRTRLKPSYSHPLHVATRPGMRWCSVRPALQLFDEVGSSSMKIQRELISPGGAPFNSIIAFTIGRPLSGPLSQESRAVKFTKGTHYLDGLNCGPQRETEKQGRPRL